MLPPSSGLESKQETSKYQAAGRILSSLFQFNELTKYDTKCLPCCTTQSETTVKIKEQSKFYNKSVRMPAFTDLFLSNHHGAIKNCY
jgi:hypothetical protein